MDVRRERRGGASSAAVCLTSSGARCCTRLDPFPGSPQLGRLSHRSFSSMARRPSSETGTLARVLGMTGAILVLPSVAIGWLYWLRALTSSWPGPKVSDALPLDELPGHAQISLIVFLGVFALAALLLGRCARRLRVDGLVGGLAAGIGVGSWLYLVATISLFVVRQVPFTVALGNARSLEAVYVAAAICAIGVAAIAERPARGTRLVTITISLVVLLSLIDLV